MVQYLFLWKIDWYPEWLSVTENLEGKGSISLSSLTWAIIQNKLNGCHWNSIEKYNLFRYQNYSKTLRFICEITSHEMPPVNSTTWLENAGWSTVDHYWSGLPLSDFYFSLVAVSGPAGSNHIFIHCKQCRPDSLSKQIRGSCQKVVLDELFSLWPSVWLGEREHHRSM